MTDDIDVPDGEYTAVVDAVEDALATIFFEAAGDEVGSVVVDASVLPADARHADAILAVTVRDADLVDADYQPQRTKARKEAAQDRFDRRSERPPADEDA
jgi:hypothetical protein